MLSTATFAIFALVSSGLLHAASIPRNAAPQASASASVQPVLSVYADEDCATTPVTIPITQAGGECIGEGFGANFSVLKVELNLDTPQCTLGLFGLDDDDCTGTPNSLPTVNGTLPVCAGLSDGFDNGVGVFNIGSAFVNCTLI